MVTMKMTIERALERESSAALPEDFDCHNYLTLVPRTHRGSNQPLNKVVDGKKEPFFSKGFFCRKKSFRR